MRCPRGRPSGASAPGGQAMPANSAGSGFHLARGCAYPKRAQSDRPASTARSASAVKISTREREIAIAQPERRYSGLSSRHYLKISTIGVASRYYVDSVPDRQYQRGMWLPVIVSLLQLIWSAPAFTATPVID